MLRAKEKEWEKATSTQLDNKLPEIGAAKKQL